MAVSFGGCWPVGHVVENLPLLNKVVKVYYSFENLTIAKTRFSDSETTVLPLLLFDKLLQNYNITQSQ